MPLTSRLATLLAPAVLVELLQVAPDGAAIVTPLMLPHGVVQSKFTGLPLGLRISSLLAPSPGSKRSICIVLPA